MHYRLLGFFMVFTSCVVSAAEGDDWAQVRRIESGTRVEVVSEGLRRTDGRFVSADDQALHLTTDAGPTSIDRKDVVRVSVKRGSRGKRTLMAAAIGAGAAVAAGVVAYNTVDIDIRRDLIIGTMAAAGGGVGAGVGASMPAFRTVYRRP